MSTTPPQFGTAEYKSAAGSESCRACSQPITGEYYRVNGIQACTSCAEKVKQQAPKDTHAAFVRGLLFGVGGAIAGLIVYSLFAILTGIVIGYVSLAVGWLVGKAIRMGSKGIGGRRYQIVAVAFTYAAVSIAAIPIGISQYVKENKNRVETSQQPQSEAGQNGAQQTAPGQNGTVDSQAGSGTGSAPAAGGAKAKPKMSVGGFFGMLLLLGLASPFLELGDEPHGIIGLIILLVGMNIAWKLTAAPKLEILGPFKAGAAAPAAG